MSAYFGGCTLTEHDPDPEGRDHKVVPGEWVLATCAEADEALASTETSVWSSFTDMEGQYGEPKIFTEWGTRDGRTPVVADLRYPDSDKPCEHMVFRGVR